MLPDALGALSALLSAATWGAGDFSGAYASRQHRPFQVLTLSLLVGVPIMVALTLIYGEGFPSSRSALLSMIAGTLGTLGLAAFYRGLSVGRVALVAPVSSVIGAGVPVVVGVATEGLPSVARLIGFLIALAAIWLVSAPRTSEGGVTLVDELRYGVLAGLGFGGFLIFIAWVDPGKVFAPLVVSKLTGLSLSVVVMRRQGVRWLRPTESWSAVLAGALDSGGNIFYVIGTQLTRLDVVAALASLFPVLTVILGRMVFRERVRLRQWIGVALSMIAILLITI